jgi:hypothetical protein
MARDVTDLRSITKKFALRIIKLYQNLPHSGEAQVIGKQDETILNKGQLKMLSKYSAFLILHYETY